VAGILGLPAGISCSSTKTSTACLHMTVSLPSLRSKPTRSASADVPGLL